MNSFKTIITGLAFLLSFNTSFANDAELKVNDETSIILSVKNKTNNFKVTLIDAQHHRLFNQKFTNGSEFTKKFNLKNLPTGQYFMKVEGDVQFQNFEINITPNEIAVKEVQNYKVFAPSIATTSDKLTVNFSTINKVVSADLSILNSRDEVIWQGSVTGKDSFGKIFDLSKLPAGAYYAQVIVDGKLYIKEFTQSRK